MRISIMIAVYKEAELLGDIVRKLLENNYQDKEILVAVDGEDTRDITAALAPYQNHLTILYNYARLGKVNSLNRLYSLATGDAFLFLDNDVELPEDSNFVSRLHDELLKSDIVELPKEAITGNRFSRIVSYDYLSSAMFCLLAAKMFKRNLFLNGAGFAIRRNVFEQLGKFSNVVNEDWTLMTKAFENRNSYGFPVGLKVGNRVPLNIPEWIDQRKRWALGILKWQQYLIKELPRLLKGLPIILNIIIFTLIPTVISLAVWRFDVFNKIILLGMTLLKHNFGVNLSALYLFSYFSTILQGWASVLTALCISGMIFFIFSRILRFRFYLIDFVLYYFIYTPFLVLCYLYYGITSIVSKLEFDWKV